MVNPKARFTRGRVLEELEDNLEGLARIKTFTFKSGRTIEFTYKTIAANDVEKLTYVDSNNIRIGEELTRESLASIIESIKHNQFQPVIAQKVNGRYSIPDGSRRRQAAIFAGVGLEMLSCEEELTKAEIKQIVKEISTSESFSLRDLGRYFSTLTEEEPALTLEEIGEREGFNKGLVSKALAAWSVPADIVLMFPVPRSITYEQFNGLSKVVSKLKGDGVELDNFIINLEYPENASNDDVFKVIADASNIKPKKASNKPRKIVDIDTKKWVKIKLSGEKSVIELARIPKAELEKIEKYIVELLSDKEQ